MMCGRIAWWLVAAVPIAALTLNAKSVDPRRWLRHAVAQKPTLPCAAVTPDPVPMSARSDIDQDGIPDEDDTCPDVIYAPQFDWGDCLPMDEDHANDCQPECKARERVAELLLTSGRFVTEIAFAVVEDGEVHFADAFSYVGQGQYVHNRARHQPALSSGFDHQVHHHGHCQGPRGSRRAFYG